VLALNALRQRIQERRRQLARNRELMTKTARRTAEAVNLGKIVEKIVPSFAGFSYESGDCRALFEPVDYLVFSGFARQNQVEALFFVDVKSGNARLEWKLRERAAKAGLRAAKRVLRKIDPVFSGSGYDPQDVKMMFDPVTYIVFDGMAQGEVTEIQLLATPPQSQAAALMQKTIDQAIRSGNVEFRTLRVGPEGRVS
jgi:predicted Holliday junction resolvase-like endonuclease